MVSGCGMRTAVVALRPLRELPVRADVRHSEALSQEVFAVRRRHDVVLSHAATLPVQGTGASAQTRLPDHACGPLRSMQPNLQLRF